MRNFDLRQILEAWPYDAERPVRLARASDGRQIMQVRLPLGIEQYEMDGRPDGRRPHGMESLLEYHRARLRAARAAGTDAAFRLSAESCAELVTEGILYYYRYLHLFQIQDWQRTVRDTGRNLFLFDFVRRHAERDEDRTYLEQWRPYILRVRSVAQAMIELQAGRHGRAIDVVARAIREIESLPELQDSTFDFEKRRSLLELRAVADQIEQSRPLSEADRLAQELERAVQTEQYERAAQLRDRLRALRGEEPGRHGSQTEAERQHTP